MKVKKEARRDAHEYARAMMFYGEGAGNRRKLIQATVEAKANRDPYYQREFDRALLDEDLAEHAAKARAERRRMDVQDNVSKNVRAVARGDQRGMNATLVILLAAATIAHKTGYDEKIIEAGKKQYGNLKIKIHSMRVEHKIRKVRKNPII